MIKTTEIFRDIIDHKQDVEYMCLMFRSIYKKLKKDDRSMFNECTELIKETIGDKTNPFSLRCMCMDLRDLVL